MTEDGRATSRRRPSPIEAAIDDVVRLTWGLTSAIGKLAYGDAARTRSELERALSRAQAVASAIPRISNRVMALDWVDELRAAAAPELAIAPAPSSAAIEAAKAGDETPWNQEEQAWMVAHLMSGSSLRIPRRCRAGEAGATRPSPTCSPNPSRHPVLGKEHMTGQLEQDVKHAVEIFLAEITRAAQRAVTEEIHSAFDRASSQMSQAVSGTSDHAPASDRPAQRRPPAPIDRASVRARVVACIRDNPGWDTTQLYRSLCISPTRLRRKLFELTAEGAIRFEVHPIGLDGMRRRLYFVIEPANRPQARTEPLAVPAPSNELHHRREPISAAPATVLVDRLVTFIRKNPGWNCGQIGRYLGIHTSKLRPPLRKLVADGTIRIEVRACGTSLRKSRAYFAVEHVNGERAEPSVTLALAEATA